MKYYEKVWLDGKVVEWEKAKQPILTHALHYATAIFEGMRTYQTKKGLAVFRMTDHYKRFLNGIKTYGFEIKYSLKDLINATKKVLKANKAKACYIRPLCFVGFKGIGLDIVGAKYHCAIIPVPFGKYFGEKIKTGIKCKVSTWTRMNNSFLCPHVKASANYLTSALAKKEARECGFDEAIMLNEWGRVAEGSGENIFLVLDGALVTPPVHESILEGITRDSVITIARDLGYEVRERPLLRDDLYIAEEVFLTGTAAEITPVINIDGIKIGDGKPGTITKKLQKRFFDVVSGKVRKYEKWLERV